MSIAPCVLHVFTVCVQRGSFNESHARFYIVEVTLALDTLHKVCSLLCCARVLTDHRSPRAHFPISRMCLSSVRRPLTTPNCSARLRADLRSLQFTVYSSRSHHFYSNVKSRANAQERGDH